MLLPDQSGLLHLGYVEQTLLRCISPVMALLGSREMSDLSPQSGPQRTLVNPDRCQQSNRPASRNAGRSGLRGPSRPLKKLGR